jgi:hypothetical protein
MSALTSFAGTASAATGSLLPPVLDPSSLYKEEARRDATRIRTYNMILNQIYNKVRTTARYAGGDKAIFYVIPELIPGTPRFDMGDAVLYIVWNLRNAGYTVEYTWPNSLFISWKAHDEHYRRFESPWSQVLSTARNIVLRGEATPSVVSAARPAPSFSTATPTDIVKRKSVLKKTEEYHPGGATMPATTNPTVMAAMYGTAPKPPTVTRLPGQLSEKHVSFV